MGAESPVESVLPGPCQETSLLRPGWPGVGWLDLRRGTPNLDVGDQASLQDAIVLAAQAAVSLAART